MKAKVCENDDLIGELEIKRNSFDAIRTTAEGSTSYDWKLLKGYFDVPLDWIIPDEEDDVSYNHGKEQDRIKALADKILENGWIEAVIVEYEAPPDEEPIYELQEGQHRARAMRLLGCTKVIAQVYQILWEGQ